MILNCCKIKFWRNLRDIAILGGNNRGKTNEDICQQRNCSPSKCTFQRCIDYVVSWAFLGYGATNNGRDGKTFSSKIRQYLENGKRHG